MSGEGQSNLFESESRSRAMSLPEHVNYGMQGQPTPRVRKVGKAVGSMMSSKPVKRTSGRVSHWAERPPFAPGGRRNRQTERYDSTRTESGTSATARARSGWVASRSASHSM